MRYPLRVKRYANGKLFWFDQKGSHIFPMNRPFWRHPIKWLRCESVVFKMQFGPGPGYCKYSEDRTEVVEKGWGVFVAWRSGSWRWKKDYRNFDHSGIGWFARKTGLEIGVTTNGNRMPYVGH